MNGGNIWKAQSNEFVDGKESQKRINEMTTFKKLLDEFGYFVDKLSHDNNESENKIKQLQIENLNLNAENTVLYDEKLNMIKTNNSINTMLEELKIEINKLNNRMVILENKNMVYNEMIEDMACKNSRLKEENMLLHNSLNKNQSPKITAFKRRFENKQN